jgi:hypothetical protein
MMKHPGEAKELRTRKVSFQDENDFFVKKRKRMSSYIMLGWRGKNSFQLLRSWG